MTPELEVGAIVLCTVERIAGTVVFVKIHQPGKDLEGSIILSEVAPGRIRNLRDYVVPKKRIICKVLRISGDRIDLSLRRVTQKEQKQIKEQEKSEKSYKSVLKSVLEKNAESIIEKIIKQETLYDFLEKAKESPQILEKTVGKENSKKILDILLVQKQKKCIVKKEITLTSTKSNGLKIIKEILGKIKDAKIKYLSAGKYTIKTEDNDPKKADNQLREILKEIEKKAKKKDMFFSIKER
ncbi:MAG: hypothetical protein KKF48_04190 [Nanoarchaeota archaeon]|nr:hypothetical protein [Nanoarchaeota archaeon]MBU1028219.1 hypothetical protein [Nanoarchaeota archaeon]